MNSAVSGLVAPKIQEVPLVSISVTVRDGSQFILAAMQSMKVSMTNAFEIGNASSLVRSEGRAAQVLEIALRLQIGPPRSAAVWPDLFPGGIGSPDVSRRLLQKLASMVGDFRVLGWALEWTARSRSLRRAKWRDSTLFFARYRIPLCII